MRDASGLGGFPRARDDLRYQVLFIISLFDGIGGLRRAAERLRLPVPLYLSAEVCPNARRVVRASWPGVVELDDVRAVIRSFLAPLILRAAEIGCSHIAVGGGWLCRDVSILNKNRKGVEGERSSLFREFIRVSRLAQELARSSSMGFVGIGECTRMNLQDHVNI